MVVVVKLLEQKPHGTDMYTEPYFSPKASIYIYKEFTLFKKYYHLLLQ